MSRTPARTTLIEELDARQNDVLSQLDELNQQLVDLLQNCTAKVSSEPEDNYDFATE